VSYHDPDPMAQAQVEREIMRLSRDLTLITEEIAHGATEAARTDVAYKLAYARKQIELSKEPGTVALKDAIATDACASEFEAMKIAEAVYKALQEKGRNVRAQLDALRTIAANVRSAVTFAHGTGG
jgi:hypothetical protein